MEPVVNPYQPPASDVELAATPTDFVTVASCATPTEAHLLKGVLGAAGLEAVVADANLAQAHFLGPALTGVRVLVAQPLVDEALQVIAAYRAGNFELPSDEPAAAPAERPQLASPLFSPDGLTLWSLALTPTFGTLLRALERPHGAAPLAAWFWLALSATTTLGLALALPETEFDALLLFRVSMLLWPLTLAWYFFVGHPASKHLVATYGPHYARRPLKLPALVAAVLLVATSWIVAAAR